MHSERLTAWRLAGISSVIACAFFLVMSAPVSAQEGDSNIDDPNLRNRVVLAVLPDLEIEVSSTYADSAFELISVYADQLQRHYNRNAYQIHAATYDGDGFTPFMIELLRYIVGGLHLQDRLVQLLDPPLTPAKRDLASYYLWIDGEFLSPTDPQTDEALFDAAIAYVSKPRAIGDIHLAFTVGELKADDLFAYNPAQSVIDRHFRIGMLPTEPFFFFDRKIEPLTDDMDGLNFQALSDSLVSRDTSSLVEKLRIGKAEAVR